MRMPTRPFTLIAHRGYSSDAPENTYEAFDLAIEHGFANIELDVQLTSDGVPVIIHDDTLDRTTNGAGPVAEASIAKIKSLDAGLWFEGPEDSVGRKGVAAHGDAFIPTLDEVLERYRGRVHFHLELKSVEPELPGRVAAALKELGWVDEHGAFALKRSRGANVPGLTISSFRLDQLERSLPLTPKIPHGWLLSQITAATVNQAKELGLAGIYPRASEVTAADVQLATDAGLIVRTWGVRTEADLRRAYGSGAVGTTVDWPGRAKKILGL
jgi:glycerophosphoryl diester phosphodiesterase